MRYILSLLVAVAVLFPAGWQDEIDASFQKVKAGITTNEDAHILDKFYAGMNRDIVFNTIVSIQSDTNTWDIDISEAKDMDYLTSKNDIYNRKIVWMHMKLGNTGGGPSFEYFNGALSRISITTKRETASYYSTTLRNDWTSLINIIESKYGKKWKQALSYPSFLNHNAAYWIPTHVMDIGSKRIEIGVGETSDDMYYAMMRISYRPLTELAEKEAAYKKKDAEKQAAGKF